MMLMQRQINVDAELGRSNDVEKDVATTSCASYDVDTALHRHVRTVT